MAEIFLPKTDEEMYQVFPKYKGENGNKIKDRTGLQIGKLRVLYRTLDIINSTDNRPRVQWVCLCECGNVVQRSSDRISTLLKKENVSCYNCKSVEFYKRKEIGTWAILDHFLYNEGAAEREHTKLTCKVCGFTYSPRTTDIINKVPECMVCTAAKKSGLINQTIYSQQILSYRASHDNIHASPIWKVKCLNCGEIVEKTTAEVKRQKSCGCMAGEPYDDALGKTYGRLTVIQILPAKTNYDKRALCKCECGNTTVVQINNLRSGHTQSCGCLQKETAGALSRLELNPGQQFGNLTVIEFAGQNDTGHTLWKCRCKCGSERNYLGYLLTTGQTTSCGCVNSKGEEKVASILIANNIPFEKYKTFDSCRFPNTNRLAFFDFFVDNKYLIEFDGIQHFEFRQNANGSKSWNTKENFEETQYRDAYKNQWCKENNITLIRIPYWEFSRITLQDLLPGSRFTYIE